MAINPALILKHIISDSEQERHTAADKLYAANLRKEFHPDDWTRGKGAKVAKIGSLNEDVLRKAEQRAKHAEASAEIEREAREKAEAEIEKLKEQLTKEQAKASGPTKPVKLLSGLLPGRVTGCAHGRTGQREDHRALAGEGQPQAERDSAS